MSMPTKLWSCGDKDIDDRLQRCSESYAWKGHLIARELKLLRDENMALINELSLREEQITKMANALSNEAALEVVTH